MVRTGSLARLASSPIDSNGPSSSMPPVCFLHPLEKQPRAAPAPLLQNPQSGPLEAGGGTPANGFSHQPGPGAATAR